MTTISKLQKPISAGGLKKIDLTKPVPKGDDGKPDYKKAERYPMTSEDFE
jgi:hypothetical protein